MKIVFDFGGVVFRWHPASFLARVWPHRIATPEQGAEAAAVFFQNYGGDWGLFDQGLIGADEVVDRISARTGWSHGDVETVVRAVPDELMPIQGTVALIQDLKAAGHSLYFLSNMPEPYADHLSASYPLAEWFESGVFSGRVKQSKPAMPIFEIAERQFGAVGAELLFIDDHPANVDAARSRDWQAFVFTDAASARRELVSRGLLIA